MIVQEDIKNKLLEWAEKYNNMSYFEEDPIIFPKSFKNTADIEISAIFAAHLAWGKRAMIVRDCERLFEHMEWKPLEYVLNGDYRDDDTSLHRTIKWSEIAKICENLRKIYSDCSSIEGWSNSRIRTEIYGRKDDIKAPNKKINMMKRWLTRNDNKVDIGIWKNSTPSELLIPLDVHVYTQSVELGLTNRKSKDIKTVIEITQALAEVFPQDPCKGDFALFGYGVSRK